MVGVCGGCEYGYAGGTITVGHQLKTDQFSHVTVQLHVRSVNDVWSNSFEDKD